MGNNTRAELDRREKLVSDLYALAIKKFVGYDIGWKSDVQAAYKHARALYSACDGLSDAESNILILRATNALVIAHDKLQESLARFFRGSDRFFKTRLFAIKAHKRFRRERSKIWDNIVDISVLGAKATIDLSAAGDLYLQIDSALENLAIAQATFKAECKLKRARGASHWESLRRQQNLLPS